MPQSQRIDDEKHEDVHPAFHAFATFSTAMTDATTAVAGAGWAAFEYFGRAAGVLASSDPKPEVAAEGYRVCNHYAADYSPITPEEIAQVDPELEALFKRSKPASR